MDECFSPLMPRTSEAEADKIETAIIEQPKIYRKVRLSIHWQNVPRTCFSGLVEIFYAKVVNILEYPK